MSTFRQAEQVARRYEQRQEFEHWWKLGSAIFGTAEAALAIYVAWLRWRVWRMS